MLKKLKKGLTNILLSTIICASGCAGLSTLPANFEPDPNSPHRKKIAEIDTIEEAMDYCLNLEYCYDEEQYGRECWVSFKKIHKSQKDDCDGGAIAAAALLSDDGYPAKIICMYGDDWGHAIFLYEKNNKYGSIGINYSDCNLASFDTVDNLVKYLGTKLAEAPIKNKKVSKEDKIKYYYILDFSKYLNDIIESDEFLDPIVHKLKKESGKYYTE